MLGDIRKEVEDRLDDDLGVIFNGQEIKDETVRSPNDFVVEVDFFEKLSNNVMFLNAFDQLFITA